jgi:protein-S-isoprenylcysteine O-methyltransferase Ste14
MNTFGTNLAQAAVFLLGSLGLIFVSRKSLLHIHSHGFYRFFAWEILLGMFLLNAETWFQNPFAWYQIISWTLLIISIALVVLGLRLLRQVGRQDVGRKDALLLALEKTSKLVTVGLYRYIRHPLYSSLLFLGWGMYVLQVAVLAGCDPGAALHGLPGGNCAHGGAREQRLFRGSIRRIYETQQDVHSILVLNDFRTYRKDDK